MENNGTAGVYLHVMDDVVNKMRDAFVEFDGDDSALTELQAVWESKMMQAGVTTMEHDLNAIYEAIEGYETPTEEMHFPSTLVQAPPPAEHMQFQYFPAGQGEDGTKPDTTADIKPGRIASYMQQPSQPWLNQKPLCVDLNIAYEEATGEGGQISEQQLPMKNLQMIPSSKRKREEVPPQYYPYGYIPREDGSRDISSDCSLHHKVSSRLVSSKDVHAEIFPEVLKLQKRVNADASIAKQAALISPKHEGCDDVLKNLDRIEDYNSLSYYDMLLMASLKPPNIEAVEDDEPPLNEDDDDDDDDDETDVMKSSINDLVLAQFDKVYRTRGNKKWKCLLKAGILHLNDKDILFREAAGEFDF